MSRNFAWIGNSEVKNMHVTIITVFTNITATERLESR